MDRGMAVTLVILIRHAHSSANGSGILAGRTAGVHLSPLGKMQARKLAIRLGDIPIKNLRLSPLERCAETIAPWLRKTDPDLLNARPPIQIDPDLAEVDYGLWSGKKLRALAKDPLWKVIQESPSSVTFPNGESMIAMQERANRSVQSALSKRGRGHVVLVSHGDVVKSIIASALNMHLDAFQRIVIDPASISILDYSASMPRLLLMNDSLSKLNPDLFERRVARSVIGGGSGTSERKKVN